MHPREAVDVNGHDRGPSLGRSTIARSALRDLSPSPERAFG
jgi:hypothetical protein